MPRSAGAGHFFDILVEVVVDRQLFTFANVPQAHIKNMALEDPRITVRVAGMVDVLSAAAIYVSVDAPVRIQSEQIIQGAIGPPLRFSPADLLAGILDNFSPLRDEFPRVQPPPVDA